MLHSEVTQLKNGLDKLSKKYREKHEALYLMKYEKKMSDFEVFRLRIDFRSVSNNSEVTQLKNNYDILSDGYQKAFIALSKKTYENTILRSELTQQKSCLKFSAEIAEKTELQAKTTHMTEELKSYVNGYEKLQDALDNEKRKNKTLTVETVILKQELEENLAKLGDLKDGVCNKESEIKNLQLELTQEKNNVAHLTDNYNTLRLTFNEQESAHEQLESSHRELKSTHKELETSHMELKIKFDEQTTAHDEAITRVQEELAQEAVAAKSRADAAARTTREERMLSLFF